MGLISVGHRPSLRLYHDRLLELDGRGGWRLDPLLTPQLSTRVLSWVTL
jgi:ABC-type uncharacterized transport system fused permease/ATPase subunit